MTSAVAGPMAVELPQLTPTPNRWAQWLSQAISVALFGAVLYQLSRVNFADFFASVPATPWFVPILLALYLALPIADWIIFRRLWGLPFAGFPILLGKRIGNELLVSYSGEVYFYLWARQRTGLTTAPFGTIKDVNILSALAGNALALTLLAVAYPFLIELEMGRYAGAAVGSAAVMLIGSIVVLLLGRRVFTLSTSRLAWVFGIHVVRLIAGVLLCAFLWHLALPGTPIGFWLALSLLRLLVGRLPLLPNKEMLFAVIAVFLVGNDDNVVALITLTSAAILLLHVVFGLLLGAGALAFRRHPMFAVKPEVAS